MPTPSTGELKWSQITAEFGSPPGIGALRVNQTFGHLANLPLDNGVPQSGQIAFSDLRGKKLNIIVNGYGPGYSGATRQDAASMYDTSNTVCVGGFRTKPNRTTDLNGRRVYIAINQKIGSDKGGRNNCALRVPSGWSTGAIIRVDIGPSGRLMGAGGNGGRGSSGDGRGSDGDSGSSALGIGYNDTRVINNGLIRRGFGGGGGGGGAYSNPDKSQEDHVSSGGGGGGGSGFPAGSGGGGGSGAFGRGRNGGGGSNGDESNGGGGGGGGNGGDADGGSGGTGAGNNNAAANGGGRGDGDRTSSGGGNGGANGYAIIKSPGVSIQYSGAGTKTGDEITGSYG